MISFEGQRGYLHLSKRWQDWLPFVTLGYAYSQDDIDYIAPGPGIGLTAFYDQIVATVREVNHNQRSISIGLRWDFTRHKALKMQCDQFYFKAGSGSIYGRVDQLYTRNQTRSWCTLALDWVF